MDSDGRLVRVGTVRESGGGCTWVEVSVPCSTCVLGCGGRRRSPRLLLGPDEGGVFAPGESVELSIARGALLRASFVLFGPTLAWVIVAAWVATNGTMRPVGVLLLAAGLVLALLGGRNLTRHRVGTLDLRVERVPWKGRSV